MNMSYHFEMPNHETHKLNTVADLIKTYCNGISIDPFARNCKFATFTNDLNPEMDTMYHLDVYDFLQELINQKVQADACFFDPPFTIGQMKEMYESIGLKFGQNNAQRCGRWGYEKKLMAHLIKIGGHVVTCGFDSAGMGIQNGFKKVHIALICHGGAHNDTIITVEKKIEHQERLL